MRGGRICIFLLGIVSSTILWGQANVLPAGNLIKIVTTQQGMYQVTGTQLQQWGVSLPIASARIKLQGFDLRLLEDKVAKNTPAGWTEIAIEIQDGGDGQFDSKDQFLFYAPSAMAWDYLQDQKRWVHKKTANTDSIYFFISIVDIAQNGEARKRIITAPYSNTTTTFIEKQDAHWLIEMDSINILNSGRQWLGVPLGQGLGKNANTKSTIHFSGVDLTQPIQFNVRYVASSYQPQGSFNLSLNDKLIRSTNVAPITGLIYDPTAKVAEDNFTLEAPVSLIGTSVKEATLSVALNASSNSTGWLDFIELQASATIDFLDQKSFAFSTLQWDKTPVEKKFTIQNADSTSLVWDVTNPLFPIKLTTQIVGSKGQFTAVQNGAKSFFAVKQDNYAKPSFVAYALPSQLLNIPAVDYVIVSAPAYMNAAKKMQQFHSLKSGMKVQVVNANQIYNEFSGGQVSAIGIRNFMKFLLEKAKLAGYAPPSHLLLMGMGNFNPAKLDTNFFLPCFESVESNDILKTYTSDDFFVLLNEGDDINVPDKLNALSLAVGRIPAKNKTEADSVVSKLIQYQTGKTKTDWQNNITWIADDGDFNLHLQDAESISTHLKNNASKWNQQKLYLDLFPAVSGPTGNTYPQLVSKMNQIVNQGTLLLNYTGHGNYLRLTEEAVVNLSEMMKWKNEGRVPLMVTASCDFAPFDQPQLNPIGFQSLLQNKMGIAGLVAASRLVFAFSNQQINDEFIQALLVPNADGGYLTIGGALAKAKQNNWSKNGDRLNAFKFNLMGDPAMQLTKPDERVILNTINQKIFSGIDTIEAAQKVHLEGSILSGGKRATSFHGWVDFSIFDAEKERKTLANISSSIATTIVQQESILFKGKATVSNGVFSLDFLLSNVYSGAKPLKLQWYAYNDSSDAFGFTDQIFIKPNNTTFNKDTVGPQLFTYINDSSFKNGTMIRSGSNLFIQLEDSSGIQTSGNVLGNDLVAILDNEIDKPILLNNYYSSNINSYTKGKVVYPLLNLTGGKHQLVIKAWDLVANSSRDTIHFEVPLSANAPIQNLMNQPNPVIHSTRFSFDIKETSSTASCVFEIYDLHGQKRYTKLVDPSLFNSKIVIDWDGMDNAGLALLPGIYIYKVSLLKGANRIELTNKLVKL